MPEDLAIYGPDTGLRPCEARCSAVPPLQDRAQANEADRETNNPNDDRREHALTVRVKSQRCCSWWSLWDSFHTPDEFLTALRRPNPAPIAAGTSRRLAPDRKRQSDGCSFAGSRAGRDGATVGFEHRLRDCQAQAATSPGSITSGISSIEAVEEVLQLWRTEEQPRSVAMSRTLSDVQAFRRPRHIARCIARAVEMLVRVLAKASRWTRSFTATPDHPAPVQGFEGKRFGRFAQSNGKRPLNW